MQWTHSVFCHVPHIHTPPVYGENAWQMQFIQSGENKFWFELLDFRHGLRSPCQPAKSASQVRRGIPTMISAPALERSGELIWPSPRTPSPAWNGSRAASRTGSKRPAGLAIKPRGGRGRHSQAARISRLEPQVQSGGKTTRTIRTCANGLVS
jgi:hypothetical protein